MSVQVNLQLSAAYVPGQKNLQANYLSRTSLDDNEWSRLLRVFRELTELGIFLPEVDCSHPQSTPSCWSSIPGPRICKQSGWRCWQQSRSPRQLIFLLLFLLILSFQLRLWRGKVTVMMIPDLSKGPWYPSLILISVKDWLPLYVRSNLLQSHIHPASDRLRLMAWV